MQERGLTKADLTFLTSSEGSPGEQQHDEKLDWPDNFGQDDRIAVLAQIRKALKQWQAEAGGETIGEDYIVLGKEEVEGGTLTSMITVHNLAMMFADLMVKRARLYRGVSPFAITTEEFAKYSEERGFGLEEYIRRPKSFFAFLVRPQL